jgi:hypothetical protein
MSVTFQIEGDRADLETGENYVNLANTNACSLLFWLGLGGELLYGSINPSELSALCRRRLWPEKRNEDPGIDPTQDGRVIDCGRRAGYLPEKARDLLKLCERANGRRIVWG